MIILKTTNFDEITKQEISCAISGDTDKLIKKKHSKLTSLGIPEIDLDKSPLVRYCHYLHNELNLEFQQPNNELVNDVLLFDCGSKLIWALA